MKTGYDRTKNTRNQILATTIEQAYKEGFYDRDRNSSAHASNVWKESVSKKTADALRYFDETE